MMKKWISLLLVALMLLAVAPVAMADPEITEDSIATIVNCKNSANVREQATSDSKKLGEAPRGRTYKLLAVEGDWYRIQFKTDKAGYVYKKYVQVGKKGDAPKTDTATVTNAPNGVNIRAKASSSSKILGVAYNGDTFEVKGKSGNWTKVAYDGDTAYIYTSYLSVTKGTDSTPPSSGTAYVVGVDAVNVRAKASSSSKRLGALKKGTAVEIVGKSGKWTKILYEDGTAWVFTQYLSKNKPDTDVDGKTGTIVNVKYGVNIRAKASSSSKKLGTAVNGDTFTVRDVSGRWVKVEYGGDYAFIYDKYIKIG